MGATITSDSVIRTKDSGYRSNVYCNGTRHGGSVTHTAEND